MFIEIISPDTTLFSGEINIGQFPGKDGSFEILNHHAPFVTVLKKGKIKLVDKDKKTSFIEIGGGVFEMQENKIIVLAD